MEKKIKIYHVVQELCAFLRTDHGQTDSHSDYNADPGVLQYYSADQRVVEYSHSDYNADLRVLQYYSADQRVVEYSHSDYDADPMVMKYSADPRVVQF